MRLSPNYFSEHQHTADAQGGAAQQQHSLIGTLRSNDARGPQRERQKKQLV